MTVAVETSGRPTARWPVLILGWARLALGLGWVVMLVLTVGLGERESSLAELEAAVRAGDVDEVVVTPDLTWSVTGGTAVELHWREGLTRYSARVVEMRPRAPAPPRDWLDGADLVRGEVADRLRPISDGLTIRAEDSSRSERTTSVLGVQAQGAGVTAVLALWLSTLLLLVASPEPWRATRWAWFWLMWLPAPLGQLAYLLLSGPAPGTSPPRGGKRLTGGSGLLLAIALGFAVNVMIAVVSG